MAAPLLRRSISSVAGSASRGMPAVVRMVTVPPTSGRSCTTRPGCRSGCCVRPRAGLRLRNSGSRPARWQPRPSPRGSPPPANCPLTNWPVPLKIFVVSVVSPGTAWPSGVGVIRVEPCMGLARGGGTVPIHGRWDASSQERDRHQHRRQEVSNGHRGCPGRSVRARSWIIAVDADKRRHLMGHSVLLGRTWTHLGGAER